MDERIVKETKVQKSSLSAGWIVFIVIAVFMFMILPLLLVFTPEEQSGNVALIEVRGVITEDGGSSFGESSASAADIVSFIRDADEDSSIQAIVIDINTPGGSAVASDEIAQELKRSSKPTVAYIHEMGTSGGYWIASATDTIIANRMSITGSIGVIASYLEFSGLMDDYGVTYQRMVAGKYKDMGTPFKTPTQEEKNLLQSKLDQIHSFFIQEIAENRKLSTDQVTRLATGEIFLGNEALHLGLVDKLGGAEVLEQHLKEITHEDTIEFVYYAPEPSIFDALLGVTAEQFFFMGRGIGSALTEQNRLGLMT
ncbi:MAG TPA: signal peptide peptidase SppA [Candidatus Nanoarchaeia archaeon]|nr:signal peptide peptidase SppA [Candidatus Nanoarchaeia archaeon]